MDRSDEEKEREKKLWEDEQILTFHYLMKNFSNDWKKYVKYMEYQNYIDAVKDFLEDINNIQNVVKKHCSLTNLEKRKQNWANWKSGGGKKDPYRNKMYLNWEKVEVNTVQTHIIQLRDYYRNIHAYSFWMGRASTFSARIKEKYQVDGKLPERWEKESAYIFWPNQKYKHVYKIFNTYFNFLFPGIIPIKNGTNKLAETGRAYIENPNNDTKKNYIKAYQTMLDNIEKFYSDNKQAIIDREKEYHDFRDALIKEEAEAAAKKAAEEAAARKAAEEEAARKAAEAERKRLEILRKQKELCDETNNSINNMINLIDKTKEKVKDLNKQAAQCREEYNKCDIEKTKREIKDKNSSYNALGKEISKMESRDEYQKCDNIEPCKQDVFDTKSLNNDVSLHEMMHKDCINEYKKNCSCILEGLENSQRLTKEKMKKTDKLIESYVNICTNRQVNHNIQKNLDKNIDAKNKFYHKFRKKDGAIIEEREILKNIALTTFASIALYYLFFEV